MNGDSAIVANVGPASFLKTSVPQISTTQSGKLQTDSAQIVKFWSAFVLTNYTYDRHTRISQNNRVVVFEIIVFFRESLILGCGKKLFFEKSKKKFAPAIACAMAQVIVWAIVWAIAWQVVWAIAQTIAHDDTST